MYLFEVCNTGNFPYTEQINYVINEGEMSDNSSKLEKGINCIKSLV